MSIDGSPVFADRPDKTIRLEATYPATDGSVPESVRVEWEGVDVPVAEIGLLIGELANVPRARYESSRS